MNRDTCPALWILRGTVYRRTTPAGRLVRRDPEHSISPETKRCRYCHEAEGIVMTDLVDPNKIEAIVGAKRHPTRHIARAISAEQKVFILHPDNCAARVTLRPLTECMYSRALDRGIDLTRWAEHQDRPVFIATNAEAKLIPHGCAQEHDPEPWLSSGLAMAQNSWWGPRRWKPRDGYCQDESCPGYPHDDAP